MNKSSVSCWDLAARDALRPRQADQDEQETKIHVHSRLALLFARRMAHVTEVVVIPVSCPARMSFMYFKDYWFKAPAGRLQCKKNTGKHPQKNSGILSWDVATRGALRPRQAVGNVEETKNE